MPNERNEKLISFNFERIRYWIGNGAHVSTPIAELLGIVFLILIKCIEQCFYSVFYFYF